MKVGFIVQIKLALIMEFASNSGLILFAIVIGLHLRGLRVHRVKMHSQILFHKIHLITLSRSILLYHDNKVFLQDAGV